MRREPSDFINYIESNAPVTRGELQELRDEIARLKEVIVKIFGAVTDFSDFQDWRDAVSRTEQRMKAQEAKQK